MRVVIDSNVFVSILIRPTKAFSAFVDYIDYIDQYGTVLYSAETLAELVDVLRRRKFAAYTTPEEVTEFVGWIVAAGELVTVSEPVTGSRNPKDNKFLAVAIAGNADYLVSGDKDLLVLGRIGSIPIVSPRDFLVAVSP